MSEVQLTLFDDQFKLKRCGTCKAEKPVDQFSKRKSTPDGLRCSCRECDAKEKSAYRAVKENRDKEKQTHQKWRLENKDRVKRTTREWYDKKRADPEFVEKSRKESSEYYYRNQKEFNAKISKRRRENLAMFKAREKAFRDANKEKIRSRDRAYYLSNKERIKAYIKSWCEANPEKVSRYNAKKRLTRLFREGNVSEEDWQAIEAWERKWRLKDAVHCYWCDKEFAGPECHADHYVPLSKGGPHHVKNLVIACAPCNLRKNNMMPEDFERLLAEERMSL